MHTADVVVSEQAQRLDRTVEQHLAALVLARLLTERAIPLDQDTAHACLRALGLGRPIVRAAVHELQTAGWRQLATGARTEPRTQPVRGSGMTRTPRQSDENETRQCRRCDTTKPVEEFRWYSKGRRRDGIERFARDPYCGPCRLEFQRERYLTTGKAEALRRVGIEVAEEDLLCVVCGRPIRDERPVGLTVFTHATCSSTRCRS